MSRPRMPLASARISAPTAPTPAPSVGVKKPNQMPPSTPTINAITMPVLISSGPIGSSSTASGLTDADSGARATGFSRPSPTSPGRMMAAMTA